MIRALMELALKGRVIVLGAALALSGATAFYARSYLLQPLPAKAKAPVKA